MVSISALTSLTLQPLLDSDNTGTTGAHCAPDFPTAREEPPPGLHLLLGVLRGAARRDPGVGGAIAPSVTEGPSGVGPPAPLRVESLSPALCDASNRSFFPPLVVCADAATHA